jgi:hypothetical protein
MAPVIALRVHAIVSSPASSTADFAQVLFPRYLLWYRNFLCGGRAGYPAAATTEELFTPPD